MANKKARTRGTGKAGRHSSRYIYREEAKDGARRARREEDKQAVRPKTGFDTWVNRQMRDPEFAAEYKRARAEIDAHRQDSR